MIFEVKKAWDSLAHPTIETGLLRLIRNALPYYLPFLKPAPPVTVYFCLNSICNMRCRMCDLGQRNRDGYYYKTLAINDEHPEISLEAFKKTIDDCASFKPFIAIVGAEPLLYRQLPEAVAHCRARGLGVSLTTAGYTLPEQAKELAEAGLSELVVSLDGPPAIHNFIRGRDQAFERAAAGAAEFRSRFRNGKGGLRPGLTATCTLSNYNYAHLAEWLAACDGAGFDRLNINHLWYLTEATAREHNLACPDLPPVSASCLSGGTRPEAVDIEILRAQLREVLAHKKVRLLGPGGADFLRRHYLEPESRSGLGRARCLLPWFVVQVLADGQVGVMTRCVSYTFGNINRDSLPRIWQGTEINRWRAFLKKRGQMPACKKCDAVS